MYVARQARGEGRVPVRRDAATWRVESRSLRDSFQSQYLSACTVGSSLLHYQRLNAITLLADNLQDPKAKKDVFILAGQSNMSGRGGVVGNKWDGNVPPQCQPQPSILRFTSQLHWEEAHEPLHQDIDTQSVCGVGPGMAFANEVLKNYNGCGDKSIGLVPCAIGGTAISQWEKGSLLYNNMFNRTKAALDQGGVLRALVWYQGEQDALSQLTADVYKQKLETFINDIRSDLQHPNLPFLQVARTVEDSQHNYVDKVREAQLGINIPNVYYVDAKGLPLEDDKLHLTTEAEAQLGVKLGDAYVKHAISH
eukprot:Gb_40403 [translate_table: standard]